MVSLVLGFPGSGKSYYAIDKIYNILTDNDKLSKYIEVIYTNINGVKFDQFPESEIRFKKLNVDDLYTYLKQLHNIYELYKNSDNVDEELIKFSKEKDFYKAYFVFDECHGFFENQDKIKIFWLTYHRHIFHEIMLLTQNKALIHSKYRAIIEIFIEAQPRSKKLFDKNLSYKEYSSFTMRKSEMFNKFSIKTNDDIFALYQSGNKSQQKSILIKFILIGVVALIFVIILFLNLFSTVSKHAVDEAEKIENVATHPTLEESKNTYHNSIKDESISSDLQVYKFLCDSKLGCNVFDSTYSVHYVNKFIHDTESKKINMDYILFNQKTKRKVFYYYVLSNEDILKQYFYIPEYFLNKNQKKDVDLSDSFEGVKL